MPLHIEPLKREELDDFIHIFWDAFEPLSANMILPMVSTEIEGLLIARGHLLIVVIHCI